MTSPLRPLLTPPPLRRRALLLAATGAAIVLATACGRKPAKTQPIPSGATVLALGDSLTWGTGAGTQDAYPAVLQELTGWHVVNAGISGNTAAQALERLPGLMAEHDPALVILCIGGNDFLRRQSASATQATIRRTVQAIQAARVPVLLVAVPQFSVIAAAGGPLSDHPLYEELADELNVAVYSGGWSEVLGDARLRSDAVHANAAGYRRFAEGLAQRLRVAGWLRTPQS